MCSTTAAVQRKRPKTRALAQLERREGEEVRDLAIVVAALDLHHLGLHLHHALLLRPKIKRYVC
jgi:hypothetical protein